MPLDLPSGALPEKSTDKTAYFAGWPLLSILLASAILWLMSWYGETLSGMVETWLNSETFAHGFLIAPICIWMIWRRRHRVLALCPQPNFWMILPLAMAGFVWLLAALAGVVVVQQYCLVCMVLCLTATVLGKGIAKELAFPLLFLLFAVPFGEFLLPWLMDQTADFAVFALRLSGIPVYREGLYFTLPSGNWSVVEACSGLRYLIASVTLGFLYAYLTYRSLSKRVIFVVLSVVVPIVANWIRAYMIVMIGHLSSMQLAAGVDHLIYGWLFFGVVMLLLFWMGTFWREDLTFTDAQIIGGSAPKSIDQSVWKSIIAATLLSTGVIAASPALASHLQRGYHVLPVLPIPSAPPGWRSDAGLLVDWNPHFSNPSAQVRQIYADEANHIELYIGYYRNQRKNAQLITTANSLVQTSNPAWGNVGTTRRIIDLGTEKLDVYESRLRGKSNQLVVLHWFWVDGQFTANQYWAKLLQAKSQLLGRGDDGAIVIVFKEVGLDARQDVDMVSHFVKIISPSIIKVLQDVRGSSST